RLGLGVAIIGTLLAETKLSNRGIGFLIIQAYSLFDMPRMYAMLIVLFVLAIGANALVGRLGGLGSIRRSEGGCGAKLTASHAASSADGFRYVQPILQLQGTPGGNMTVIIRRGLAAALLLAATLPAAADDAVKLTIGQRGNWDTAIAQLGTKAGIFKKHG